MDLAARKRALRRELRLRSRDPQALRRAGERACAFLVDTPEFQAAARVGLFASLADEIDTRPLFQRVLASAKQAWLPSTPDAGGLVFRRVQSWDELRPGRYGVLEPPRGSLQAAAGELDLVVVPGIAFDSSGRRLGRGAGAYDRGLAGLRRARLFGFACSDQLLEELPAGALDVRMGAIATEAGVMRTSERSAGVEPR